jgi:hypothetical protein
MNRTIRLLVSLTFLLAIIAPGCYTILQHPADGEGYRANQTSDCTRCHADYHSYPYGYYYSPYPSYWWEYPHYSHYYAYPWWWSYYDYPYLEGDNEYDTYVSDPGTKFDRREVRDGPMPPPHSFSPGGGYDAPIIPSWESTAGGRGTTGSGTVDGARPPTGTTGSETGSRSKDETAGSSDSKDTRDPAVDSRPQPKSDPTVKQDTPKQGKTETEKKEEKGKKKPRQEGSA